MRCEGLAAAPPAPPRRAAAAARRLASLLHTGLGCCQAEYLPLFASNEATPRVSGAALRLDLRVILSESPYPSHPTRVTRRRVGLDSSAPLASVLTYPNITHINH